jgi:uncharacterized protein YdeI (YjbR/CyaY-like superfamily)
MGKRDPRVEAYIADAPGFARPILNHIRDLVHAACPKVEETMKWSSPNFGYKGMLCSIAAFNRHCSLGFWKGELVLEKTAGGARGEGMGHFGRIIAVSDLPNDKVLLRHIRKAVQLNEAGISKPMTPRSKAKKNLVVPHDLEAALKKNRKALATFEKFSYSHKREYVEWITEAKREETRQKRLVITMEWLAEGKPRNWKYLNC